MSSIDHVPEQETADAPAEQVAVDGSIGSDTDTAGPPQSEATGKDEADIKHHVRSNSVKKPATFKAVSVTKNFLAKAGTPAASAAKTNGDNGNTVFFKSRGWKLIVKAPNSATAGNPLPPALRPRLVAKTASGNKVSTPKPSHFGSKHGASGPDPMQVWNRNRGKKYAELSSNTPVLRSLLAAPQPAQKHFTDEELKQQYGIHLATRLQADGDGKESKWADIDDDEDDWAPETIEWNDGTKITLSQNDSAAILAEEQAAALIAKERQAEENRSKASTQQKPTTTVGPNATVLKPRSAAQPKPGGLVLKTPSDKPTLVAKPAAPAPVRSPWASLPPVEKVPPVEINPPSRPSTSRPPQNDAYGHSAVPPPAPPQVAMEIAADDFTRTRRDPQNGNLGQLYNAQSGQYEPANNGRRGSVRKDQNFRPPSLLQRGTTHDQQGPAEQSAVSQIHRSGSQQEGGPGTTRGSSTVSGDSGPQGRRTSMNRGADLPRIPHDLLQQRRESQPLQSPSTPGFGSNQVSQRGSSPSQQLPRSAAQSPAMQHSQLSQEPVPVTGPPYHNRSLPSESAIINTRDDVAAQKQLMKEKREMAIKRKKEEEEREEAAKKERIRLKMEKLGLPPLEERKEPEKKTIEKRGAESVKDGQKETEKLEARSDVPTLSHVQQPPNSTPLSPPKPPMPDASGTLQQYGMIKVHGSPSNKIGEPVSESLNAEKTRAEAPNQLTSPPGLEVKTDAIEHFSSSMVNGVNKQTEPLSPKPSPDVQHLIREQRQQPWNNGSRDNNGYSGWNAQNAGMPREQSVSNSVWGPPNRHRTLGNGTFDRSVQRPQSRPQEHFSSPALAPIGPPRHLQRLRELPHARTNDINPTSMVEDFQTIPTYPPSEAPLPSTRTEITSRPTSEDQKISPLHTGAETLPRSQISNSEGPSSRPEAQKSTLAAWGNFHAADAEKTRQLAQQHAARLAEESMTGIRHEPSLPVMNETWRQVKVDEIGGQRHIIGVSRGQNTHGQNVAPQVNGEVHNSSFTNSAGITPAIAAGVGRGSRFFPSAGRGIQTYFQGVPPFLPGYARSPSPPPPDNDIHPVFTGDRGRPLVNLPFMKEKPKVRLPPSAVTPAQSPQMAEVRISPLRAASQPLVNNPSWQDRFNGLLGVKKTSPEKKFAHVAEFSATKVPLDSPEVQVSASVSLPPKNGEANSRSLEASSKAMEDEEALFENREFGSLPAVLIPSKVPEIGWSSAKSMRRGQYKQSRLNKEVEALSKEPFMTEEELVANNGVPLIFVKLFGMAVSKSVPLPRSNAQNPGSGVQRPRNVSGNMKPGKPYKPRDSSGSYGYYPSPTSNHNPKNSNRGPQRDIALGGPNPQARQPSKNHSAWGARATSVVH